MQWVVCNWFNNKPNCFSLWLKAGRVGVYALKKSTNNGSSITPPLGWHSARPPCLLPSNRCTFFFFFTGFQTCQVVALHLSKCRLTNHSSRLWQHKPYSWGKWDKHVTDCPTTSLWAGAVCRCVWNINVIKVSTQITLKVIHAMDKQSWLLGCIRQLWHHSHIKYEMLKH